MNLKRTRILLFCFLLAGLSTLVSCGRFRSHTGNQHPAATHQGTGVIESIDLDQKTVRINHDEIKGYMQGMSMMFKVKKKVPLGGFEKGDKVDFSMVEGPVGPVITDLKKKQ